MFKQNIQIKVNVTKMIYSYLVNCRVLGKNINKTLEIIIDIYREDRKKAARFYHPYKAKLLSEYSIQESGKVLRV